MFILKNYLFVFFAAFICSCCKRNIASLQNNTPAADTTMTDPKLKEATVIDYSEVDGCRFLLELASNEKLQPENLPVEYQRNKLKVFIKYHSTNKITICMAGKTVYLDFIKIKKE